MQILILSHFSNLYSTRRLREEAESGHEVQVLNPESDLIFQSALPQKTKLIPRLGWYNFHPTLQRLQKHFASSQFLNEPLPYARARNKSETLKLLKENDVPVTEGATWSLPAEESQIAALMDFPVIVKMNESSKGNGVFLAENRDQLRRLLKNEFSMQSVALVQRFYSECRGRDLRVFFVGNQHWAMERQASNGDFRSNMALGAQGLPTQLSEAELASAKRAYLLSELDYAGVDLLRTDTGPRVIEVNACPGLEGLETTLKCNVAKEIISWAEQKWSADD